MSSPFARAVDLSGFKRPPASAPSGGSGGGASNGTYVVQATEQNFQALIQESGVGPVLLVAYSPSQAPASVQLADDLATVVDEFDGRYLLGKIDIDAQPAIVQALQVTTVPLVVAVLQGRPQPLFQSTAPIEEIRALLNQLAQSLVAQGVTSRHQPLGPAPAGAPASAEGAEPPVDPRYAPAEDALVAGDLDKAIEEYARLVAESPADTEAAIGLSRAKLLKRTTGADLNAARAAAAASPDDVDAQILVADLDLLGGHVDDAFARLIETIKRTSDKDREAARLHLVELFGVVGDDPRVLKARQALASALF